MKGSVQYLHMQECLVYAAVDVLHQAFEGASMFRYGNKTQAFTKIRLLQGRDDRASQGSHGASIDTWTLGVHWASPQSEVVGGAVRWPGCAPANMPPDPSAPSLRL